MPITLSKRLSNSLKDNWVTGREAYDVVTAAQKDGVTKTELRAVTRWVDRIESKDAGIANGTRALIDAFITRHDRTTNLETAPKSKLKKEFDQINFWFMRNEIGAKPVSYAKLPAPVRAAYDASLRTLAEDFGMSRQDTAFL